MALSGNGAVRPAATPLSRKSGRKHYFGGREMAEVPTRRTRLSTPPPTHRSSWCRKARRRAGAPFAAVPQHTRNRHKRPATDDCGTNVGPTGRLRRAAFALLVKGSPPSRPLRPFVLSGEELRLQNPSLRSEADVPGCGKKVCVPCRSARAHRPRPSRFADCRLKGVSPAWPHLHRAWPWCKPLAGTWTWWPTCVACLRATSCSSGNLTCSRVENWGQGKRWPFRQDPAS